MPFAAGRDCRTTVSNAAVAVIDGGKAYFGSRPIAAIEALKN